MSLALSAPPPWACPDADAPGRARSLLYPRKAFLGRGGFAEVHLCDSPDGTEVALKSVSRAARSGGVNLAAVKELQALQEVQGHPNVVRLLDAFAFGDRVHLVLEHCATNLAAIARDPATALPERAVRGHMVQVLRGLAHVHACGLMHRDLKPDNVLVTAGGGVRLADFGHAARIPGAAGVEAAALHPRVVSLWWRAPELLLRAPSHGPAVDVWSVGTLLGELLIRAPLFPSAPPPGEAEEVAQWAAVVRVMGSPVDTAAPGGAACHWPGCSALPGAMALEARSPQPWRAVHPAFEAASPECIDFLTQCLQYDPLQRPTAEQALRHPWFAAP